MARPDQSDTARPGFDRVAGIYRWAEYLALGPVLQRARTYFLPHVAACRSGFVLGDGDGRFLAALFAANGDIHALTVDSSARMIALLRGRCTFAANRLSTLHSSALGIEPPPGTDLVVTHFFLDCLEQSEVEKLVRHIAIHCNPGTLWLITDFQIPASRWLRYPAQIYIRLLYLAFRLLTGLRVQRLPETRMALQKAGFRRIAYRQFLAGLVYTELWQLGTNDKMAAGAAHNPYGEAAIHNAMAEFAQHERQPQPATVDPVPDPEPAVPSLPEPDPGVYHHEPGSVQPHKPVEDQRSK